MPRCHYTTWLENGNTLTPDRQLALNVEIQHLKIWLNCTSALQNIQLTCRCHAEDHSVLSQTRYMLLVVAAEPVDSGDTTSTTTEPHPGDSVRITTFSNMESTLDETSALNYNNIQSTSQYQFRNNNRPISDTVDDISNYFDHC